MMKKIFILLISLLPLYSYSQISDDFEDGNLMDWTQDDPGRWESSTDNPINGTYSLHHTFNNTIADHDQISIPFGSLNINLETTTWRFKIKHTNTPSTFNNWACILFSDLDADYMHPDSSFNGYVLGVNFTGSDDEIKLWKMTGTTKTEIINTGIDWETEIGTSGIAGFEIKRTSSGEWSIFLDNTGEYDNLTQIGSSAVDTDHITSSFFGFHYDYSSAQDMKLWFDDVYIGAEIVDTDPPLITSANAIANNTLIINYNENVSETSSENVSNYTVDGGLGNPQSATRNGTDYKQVELIFLQNFADNQSYELTVNSVEDLTGNPITNETENFTYLHISPINAVAISSNELDVYFNKNLNLASGVILTNYTVNGGIGNPESASVDGSDNKLVHLTFSDDFISGQLYSILIENVQDTYGNTIVSNNIEFTYYIAQVFDIVVNEIMCDVNPIPNPYLPPSKYIEIYNTSNFDLNLSGWSIQIGSNSEKTFPDIVLPSSAFAIVCDDTDETSFSSFGLTVPILNPSELTTTGKRIIIRNNSDEIIEDLTYSKDWYDDEDKDDGGWSLERIDPDNFCGEDDNWTAYDNDQLNYGGTPGSINSVDANNIDETYPELVDINVITSNYIILLFNKGVSYLSGSELLNYAINNGINNPSEAYTNSENTNEVHLKFLNQFEDGQNYTIRVEGVEDNCNNVIPVYETDFTYYRLNPENILVIDDKNLKISFSETVEFNTGTEENNYLCNNEVGNPNLAVRESADTTVIYLQFESSFPDGIESILTVSNLEDINGNQMVPTDIPFTYYFPKENDILINEVLFNPYPNGNDFIEILNNSEYDINITDLQIATKEKDYPDSIISISTLSNETIILKPEEYMAFTTNKEGVQYFYMSYNEQNIIETESLPAFNDDSGKVVLLYKNKNIIDEFNYKDEFHLKLIKDTEGVSLERVNPDRKTQDPTNWHSASENVGYATPAYENSQFNNETNPEDNPVFVDPYIFSPDNDGMDDYANIFYQFINPGYIATVYIFDSKGRIVRQIANNSILATKGKFVWDGLYADYKIAPAGTYLIWFRINDLNGNVKVYKKAVVLAKRY